MNAGVTECRDVRFSGRFPGIETSKKRRKFYVEDRTLRCAKAVGHQNSENAEMPRQTVVGICTTSVNKVSTSHARSGRAAGILHEMSGVDAHALAAEIRARQTRRTMVSMRILRRT